MSERFVKAPRREAVTQPQETGRLVIERKGGESVLIGGDCLVTIGEESTPGSVRLVIEAPRGVKIHRCEVGDGVPLDNFRIPAYSKYNSIDTERR